MQQRTYKQKRKFTKESQLRALKKIDMITKQLDKRFGGSQFVGCTAHVFAVLSLLNRQNKQGRISEFIGSGEM